MRKDRLRFPDSPDSKQPNYHFESLDFPVPSRPLNSYFAEFDSAKVEDVRIHEHPGIEVLYVLSGRLEVRTARDEHVLGEGDAIYFDASVPHGYRRVGSKKTTALVVALEPRS